MAHKKGQGSSRNGRDSGGQRRGIKVYDGQVIHSGTIIVRQRGTQIHPGHNVGLGSDYTIFATINGKVKYEPHTRGRRKVSVYAVEGLPLKTESKKAAKRAAGKASRPKVKPAKAEKAAQA